MKAAALALALAATAGLACGAETPLSAIPWLSDSLKSIPPQPRPKPPAGAAAVEGPVEGPDRKSVV